MGSAKQFLSAMIDQTPIFSTHEHHRESDFHTGLTLDKLLRSSYVSWCSTPLDSSKEERKRWLDTIRTNSYFVWLEKSIAAIYKFDEIHEDNWDHISEAISKAHQDKEFHWRILKEHAKYKRFMEDSYWNPGSHLSYPEFVVSTYRMDNWLTGYHPESVDHDNTNPRQFTDVDMSSLDAYEAALISELDKKKEHIVAIKCAAAYERTLKFDRTDRRVAAKIYGKHPSVISDEEKAAFSNYMFHHFLKVARERNLPVQFHTGLAQLSGSNPMLLEPVIANNPDVKFVLFHGGFPWIYEIAGLAHNFKNVYIDMNWLPLISTKAAETALHTYLEIVPNNHHISWGGDTWTSEEAYGASMAFKHVVTNVLAEKVESSFYSLKVAERIVEKLMYQNAEELYGIFGNSKSCKNK